MARSTNPKFETIDISKVSEYSGGLFSANNILILFGVPYARALKTGKPDKVRALYFKQKNQVRAIVSNTDDQADFELAIRLAAYDILKS